MHRGATFKHLQLRKRVTVSKMCVKRAGEVCGECEVSTDGHRKKTTVRREDKNQGEASGEERKINGRGVSQRGRLRGEGSTTRGETDERSL